MLLLVGALGVGAQATPPALTWPKADLFWFVQIAPAGPIWLKVDATHGVKEPLFDHQRLAIELSLRSGSDFTPTSLPFADPAARFVVKYDGSNAYIQEGAMAIEFVLDQTQWRCDLQIKWDWNRVPPTDYECLPRRPAPPMVPAAGNGPVRSPDGRWDAFVENHNLHVRAAGGTTARALTTDGSASDAYRAGSIRWTADSAIVSAWRVNARVWESPSITANVKSLLSRHAARVSPAMAAGR